MARPDHNARVERMDEYRAEVLSHPLAAGIDSSEVAEHLASLPEGRSPRYRYDNRGSRPYTQPRGGFPSFEAQRELTLQLAEAGADFIPLTIDSYTRQNEYDTATQLLQRSELEERDYLNGYPLVSHGYEITRDLYRDIDAPISLRHGTPDARLLVEIAIAAGINEIEGGGICYCLPYSEGFPLDRCLLYWQYVDRLCALYSTPDRPLHRESFGPLSATMVPPAIVITIQIIEALLAAEQGVRSFAVSYGQTGSVIQDVALARVLRKLSREYLDESGFNGMTVDLVYHQWMGQFPAKRERAAALIACSAMIADLVGADKVVVKTVDEALGVPSSGINANAVDAVRYILETFSSGGEITSPQIDTEITLIESESRALLDAIYDLSGDSFWESVFRAFHLGWLDVPFSPHADNANKLITIRDANGSIRISNPGALPINGNDMALEQELIKERVGANGKTYRRLLDDINLMV